MKHIENSNTYNAEEGKTIRRKSDNFNMGTGICLGTQDSIDNYYEDDMTEEEIAEHNKMLEERYGVHTQEDCSKYEQKRQSVIDLLQRIKSKY